jgi:hypothetical protein
VDQEKEIQLYEAWLMTEECRVYAEAIYDAIRSVR